MIYKSPAQDVKLCILKMDVKLLFFLFSFFSLLSCSENDDVLPKQEVAKGEIILEKVAQTKSSLGDTNTFLYNLKSPWGNFDSIPLSDEQVNMCKNAKSMGSVVSKTVTGYNGSGYRNGSVSQKIYLRGYLDYGGIPDGYYIARDIWLFQSTTIPTPMAIVFPDNSVYSDFHKMGYNPDALSQPGLTCAVSGTKVSMQTGALKIEYTFIGQEVMMTFPVRTSLLEWHFNYIPIN